MIGPGAVLGLPLLSILTFLSIAGVMLAILFRRFIVAAEGWANLIAGAVLPYVGCLFFTFLLSIVNGVRTGDFGEVFVLPVWGLLYSLAGFYLIVPYGIACQYAMRAAGRCEPRRSLSVGIIFAISLVAAVAASSRGVISLMMPGAIQVYDGQWSRAATKLELKNPLQAIGTQIPWQQSELERHLDGGVLSITGSSRFGPIEKTDYEILLVASEPIFSRAEVPLPRKPGKYIVLQDGAHWRILNSDSETGDKVVSIEPTYRWIENLDRQKRLYEADFNATQICHSSDQGQQCYRSFQWGTALKKRKFVSAGYPVRVDQNVEYID